MNKQVMKQLHKRVCQGKAIPDELKEDYKLYVEEISPSIEDFKPVAFGRARANLKSGLLNELSAPAGMKYVGIGNWWSAV